MIQDFIDGGKEDWQRRGLPKGEVDAIAKDAPSWNLGYVTQMTDFPNVAAEIGGGLKNMLEYLVHPNRKPPSWHFGMDLANDKNLHVGAAAAKAETGGFHESILKSIGEYLISFAPGFWRHNIKASSKAGWEGSSVNHDTPRVRRLGNGTITRGGTNSPVWEDARVDVFQDLAGAELPEKDFKASQPAAMLGSRAWNSGMLWQAQGKDVPSFSSSSSTKREYRESQVAGHGGLEESLGLVPGLADREELPSFAPVDRRDSPHEASSAERDGSSRTRHSVARKTRSSHDGDVIKRAALNLHAQDGSSFAGAHLGAGPVVADEVALSRALGQLLDRQARLPPSGMTGFDPRLSPAWAGLKIPG